MTHNLKTHPEPFQALWRGRKTFEFRRDDREPRFQVGDWLKLIEWCPERRVNLGRDIHAIVTYIARGPMFDIPEGYAVMSIDITAKSEPFVPNDD